MHSIVRPRAECYYAIVKNKYVLSEIYVLQTPTHTIYSKGNLYPFYLYTLFVYISQRTATQPVITFVRLLSI